MDLIEEYNNLERPEQPISNTEIYKLQEFYSDTRYVPPEQIYRTFPLKESPPVKNKSLLELFKLTVTCIPYFIIKVEYN
jgi:hypothetical protein